MKFGRETFKISSFKNSGFDTTVLRQKMLGIENRSELQNYNLNQNLNLAMAH